MMLRILMKNIVSFTDGIADRPNLELDEMKKKKKTVRLNFRMVDYTILSYALRNICFVSLSTLKNILRSFVIDEI